MPNLFFIYSSDREQLHKLKIGPNDYLILRDLNFSCDTVYQVDGYGFTYQKRGYIHRSDQRASNYLRDSKQIKQDDLTYQFRKDADLEPFIKVVPRPSRLYVLLALPMNTRSFQDGDVILLLRGGQQNAELINVEFDPRTHWNKYGRSLDISKTEDGLIKHQAFNIQLNAIRTNGQGFIEATHSEYKDLCDDLYQLGRSPSVLSARSTPSNTESPDKPDYRKQPPSISPPLSKTGMGLGFKSVFDDSGISNMFQEQITSGRRVRKFG